MWTSTFNQATSSVSQRSLLRRQKACGPIKITGFCLTSTAFYHNCTHLNRNTHQSWDQGCTWHTGIFVHNCLFQISFNTLQHGALQVTKGKTMQMNINRSFNFSAGKCNLWKVNLKPMLVIISALFYNIIKSYYMLVFTSEGVGVGVVIRRVELYHLVFWFFWFHLRLRCLQ